MAATDLKNVSQASSTPTKDFDASAKSAIALEPQNSMGMQSFHRVFALPVDSEHKSKVLRIFSWIQPHMRSFHLAWIAFFISFFATFAPASLLPTIRENLDADKWQLGSAGTASVCGAVVCRMFIGSVLDTLGPRVATGLTMLAFAPAVWCMALVDDVTGFIIARLFIGCSLCMFVCCQYWVGTMFNVRIVGTANAIAAGWGNSGGGACSLIMPLIYQGMTAYVPAFSAWRYAFFVPAGAFMLCGTTCMVLGQDAPDGDFRDLQASGAMAKKGQFWAAVKCGLGNYRTWVLALTYGYCFGVELTVDNIIVSYLYDQFGLSLVTAGALGGMFGLMNVFTRATGGLLSDIVAAKFGMRGRLWVLWTIQALGGLFCLIMSYVSNSLGATLAVMLIFSIFCQQACGATYGVVPFVSRRAYGVVGGTVGGGGNVGSIVTQVIFFAGSTTSPVLSTQEGLRWMGVMTMGITLFLSTLYWPMWGGMFFKGNDEYAEEDYYLKEWSAEEVAQGLHGGSMKFAMESRSQRGSFRSPGIGTMSGKALSATLGMANNTEPVAASQVRLETNGADAEPPVMPTGKA